ncbi:MAG: hypothetical protein IRZ28_19585 [Steroidobacteraceae bacterium]|nr:hypothetical protein [Steroidobacteraceae bacterium]
MANTSVLAIGLDPRFADLSAFPQLTPELVRDYIDAQIDRVRQAGYDVESCLIDRGETAEAVVERALRSKRYDCIVIGAGLREPPALLMLFEKVINLVHILAPQARISFNTNPQDTLDAVRRWFP